MVFPSIHELEDELLLAELHINIATTNVDYIVGMDTNHMLSFPCDSTTPLAVCRRRKLLKSMETTKYIEASNTESAVIDFTEELRKWFSSDGLTTRLVELWTYRGTEDDLRRNDQLTEDMDAVTNQHRRKMVKLLSDREFLTSTQEYPTDVLQSVNLVVYTKGSFEQSIVHDRMSQSLHLDQNRHRRSTDEERMERRRKKKERQLRNERRQELQRQREAKLAQKSADRGPCRVVEMQVDFQNIGWSKWILYPTNFNAKRCAGHCSGPLEAIHNPSNHAVMQDLIRMKMPGRAPEPCCIPTRLQPLSMLYVEDGTIVVRHHEEMVADECGCR